ncbi:Rieske (2Fe-2S) protein [Reichenbachiella versicolor]|uniref:Rieske (2Fe-2S) protein n=1 Tax=Reichenbachiella versicolor TaxID=1821036 RepID=UPI000D6E683A|nr:Rieske (2Fe-2S) protein [Reichenbachiella versicolor]
MPKYLLVEGEEKAKSIFPLNKLTKLKADDFIFCLVRTNRGYYAFEKSCPHQGHTLSLARINNTNQLVCPLHGYAFDLDYGDEDSYRCRELKRYKTYWEKDHLYIEF